MHAFALGTVCHHAKTAVLHHRWGAAWPKTSTLVLVRLVWGWHRVPGVVSPCFTSIKANHWITIGISWNNHWITIGKPLDNHWITTCDILIHLLTVLTRQMTSRSPVSMAFLSELLKRANESSECPARNSWEFLGTAVLWSSSVSMSHS